MLIWAAYTVRIDIVASHTQTTHSIPENPMPADMPSPARLLQPNTNINEWIFV